MSQCKGCNKEILWGTTSEGRQIPLDPAAPVYSLIESGGQTKVVRTELAMVSHFATCSKANDFSASRKQEVPA